MYLYKSHRLLIFVYIYGQFVGVCVVPLRAVVGIMCELAAEEQCVAGQCMNPSSTGTHFDHEFWAWLDAFIDIRKGLRRLEGQSLYYFNPLMSFWSCRKSSSNKQNDYENASQYWRG